MVEEYDWKMVNMIKGPNNRKIINKITDRADWNRKKELDDDFFEASLKGKV